MSKEKYLLESHSERYYQLMNQLGVKHHILPSPSVHNATWDAYLTSEKEVFFSLCSELTTSEFAKFARFDREAETIEELFYTKETYFNNPRQIRDSKIHTCLSEMEDGRLIMLTHTTDKAPEHPAWLPNAHYANPWTGYAGSQLLIFDPKTNDVEYLGIPVQRETLYGAVYSKKTKCYYALGFLKGHLYKIDIRTKEVKDYGQIVERASYRLTIASDDNIYFSSRNGILMRLDTDTDTVVNLHHQLPNDYDTYGKKRGYICYMVNGPDSRLYIATQFTDILAAYDPKKNELEVLGSYKLSEFYSDVTPCHDHVGAMDFDKDGVLYAVVCAIRADGQEDYKIPASLIRWDVLNKKSPEFLGIVGSEQKAIVTSCSLLIDKDSDEMFIFATNHGNDAPDIIHVDLSVYRSTALQLGPKCHDIYIDPSNLQHVEHNQSIITTQKYWAENSFYCMTDKVTPVAIWQELGLHPGSVKIDNIQLDENITVFLSNGQEVIYSFDGKFMEEKTSHDVSNHEYLDTDCAKVPFYYPGRQYLSTIVKTIALSNGDIVSVTEDGLLALKRKNGSWCNYGPVWINARLISWSLMHKKDIIYGVAGDPDDFSVVFRWSAERGIEWLGYLGIDTIKTGAFNSPLGGVVAIDKNDKYLVIASNTTMPAIYIYDIGGE